MHIPTFTGEEDDYAVWWTRFRAFATFKKFVSALDGDVNLPSDPNVLDSDATKKALQEKAIEENSMAVSALTMGAQIQMHCKYTYHCFSKLFTM